MPIVGPASALVAPSMPEALQAVAWSEPVFSVIPPQRGHGLYARKTPQGRGLRGRCKHEQAIHQALDAARDANMSTFDLRARRLARRSSAAGRDRRPAAMSGPPSIGWKAARRPWQRAPTQGSLRIEYRHAEREVC